MGAFNLGARPRPCTTDMEAPPTPTDSPLRLTQPCTTGTEALPTPNDSPLLLSMQEAHRWLGAMGMYTFKCEVYANRIRSIKVGKRRLIPVAALSEYVEDRLAETEER